MNNQNVVRAWKDPGYRNMLSEAEREALPAHPAGLLALSDEDLGKVSGALPPIGTFRECTFIFCITIYPFPC